MTWSYSRLTAFDDCHYKWFLNYLYRDEDGLPLQKQSNFFAEFGSYIHLILQMYLSGVLDKEALPSFYLKHFISNVHSSPPNSKIYQNYFNQGLRYVETIALPKREIIGVEKNINFTFAGKPWTAFVDEISSDGRLIITDHKSRTLKPRSGRSKKTKSDAELDEYLRQLYVYSAAVKESYGCYPDILEFNCFRSGVTIQEPFDMKRYWQVEDWAKKKIETVTTNDNWNANPDFWQCHYLCDMRQECEMSKNWR